MKHKKKIKRLHPIIADILDKPPKELKQIILPKYIKSVDINKELQYSLNKPINSKRLKDIVEEKDTIAIVAIDDSRVAPQKEMIEAILKEIEDSDYKNIFILIANGTHRKTDPEVLGLGNDIISKFKIYNHDAKNIAELDELGKVSSRFHKLDDHILNDNDLEILGHICRDEEDKIIFKKENLSSKGMVYINKKIFEADTIILLGSIKPHYFAGYSGGVKTLIPGVADRRFIIRNHLLKIHPKSDLGVIEGNLIREEIEEVAKLLRKKVFCLNVVLNSNEEVIKAVSGDMIHAHRKGVAYAKKVFEVKAKKADVVIISDKYPVSVSIKQIKKVIGAAGKIVRKNGVIIVVANCQRGIGSSSKINDLVYKLYLRNKIPKNVDLFLISDLFKEEVEMTGFFDYAPDMKFALNYARKKIDEELDFCVIPYGSLVIPVTNGD